MLAREKKNGFEGGLTARSGVPSSTRRGFELDFDPLGCGSGAREHPTRHLDNQETGSRRSSDPTVTAGGRTRTSLAPVPWPETYRMKQRMELKPAPSVLVKMFPGLQQRVGKPGCIDTRGICGESQVGLCGSMWRAAVLPPCSTHRSEWLCHHISAQRLGTSQASGPPSPSHSPLQRHSRPPCALLPVSALLTSLTFTPCPVSSASQVPQ